MQKILAYTTEVWGNDGGDIVRGDDGEAVLEFSDRGEVESSDVVRYDADGCVDRAAV